MTGYKVLFTQIFDKKLDKKNNDFKNWFIKILDKVVINPYAGKPIRKNFFREKKFGKNRVYFIIHEKLKVVYFVNMSEKKDQQKIIESIYTLFDIYKSELDLILDKPNERV